MCATLRMGARAVHGGGVQLGGGVPSQQKEMGLPEHCAVPQLYGGALLSIISSFLNTKSSLNRTPCVEPQLISNAHYTALD